MTEYKIECRYNRSDTITVLAEDGEIWFKPGSDNVSPTPDAARTFARGILALADEVDGGAAKAEPAEDTRPKVGDRVIVVEDDPDDRTGEFVGLVGTVVSVNGGFSTPFKVKFGDGHHGRADGYWWCRGVKPASPAADTITTPTREAYLHRAAELLGANPSASDLIELADYLAGEGA
ncbi:hypothetical protein [Streptomyces sp. SID2119]|uniref:hypothetical protein n=1 Tax=Streptomyces sp. SID2119 TaxID=2690253 RepID=UPI00136EAF76|nr:hypothetical protein [Streptomyces sp. SID2119]MYW28212.1 hypothetical protein [Streptomyces sp. SID2119]